MVFLLNLGIEFVTSVVFLIPAVLILQYGVFKQHSFSKLAAVAIFSLYLLGVFSVVGLPTATSWHVNFHFNLIPLIDIVTSPLDYIRNTILNIVLFVPFGFLVPAVWKEYRSRRKMALTGCLLSLFIEILQIFTFRLTDVDDLITNTGGTMLGYYIASRFSFRLPFQLEETEEERLGKWEPILYIGVMFLIAFCLKPFLSELMWDKVLSSTLWENIKNG